MSYYCSNLSLYLEASACGETRIKSHTEHVLSDSDNYWNHVLSCVFIPSATTVGARYTGWCYNGPLDITDGFCAHRRVCYIEQPLYRDHNCNSCLKSKDKDSRLLMFKIKLQYDYAVWLLIFCNRCLRKWNCHCAARKAKVSPFSGRVTSWSLRLCIF